MWRLCATRIKVFCDHGDSKWVCCDFLRPKYLRDFAPRKTDMLQLYAIPKKVCCNHCDLKWVCCVFAQPKILRDFARRKKKHFAILLSSKTKGFTSAAKFLSDFGLQFTLQLTQPKTIVCSDRLDPGSICFDRFYSSCLCFNKVRSRKNRSATIDRAKTFGPSSVKRKRVKNVSTIN